MPRFRFSAVVVALALSLGIVALAGAQTLPWLFIDTVRDAQQQHPAGNAGDGQSVGPDLRSGHIRL